MVLCMYYQRRLLPKSTLGYGLADQDVFRKVGAAHRLHSSFHSFERIAPSNRGTEHLMYLGPAIDAPSPIPARTGDGVGYSAKHLVA